jgi:hypothetical protein
MAVRSSAADLRSTADTAMAANAEPDESVREDDLRLLSVLVSARFGCIRCDLI